MRSLEVAAGQLAGFGVKLWTVVQDLTQLKRIYPEEAWETFVGNASILTFFANNDATTLKYISERLGNRTMMVEQRAFPNPEQCFAAAAVKSETVRGEPRLSGPEAQMKFDRETKRLLVLTPKNLPAIME